MTLQELLVGLFWAAVGGGIGWFTSWVFYRRGSARRRLEIGLRELAHIDPATLGVQLEMRVGAQSVTNLYVLEVTVTNRGPGDLVVADATDLAHQTTRPRIALPGGVRALADPWVVDGSTDLADVRIARSLKDDRQWLYVHVHRLAVGATSTTRVVCTARGAGPVRSLDPSGIDFLVGFLEDVTVEPTGLLKGTVRAQR